MNTSNEKVRLSDDVSITNKFETHSNKDKYNTYDSDTDAFINCMKTKSRLLFYSKYEKEGSFDIYGQK